MLPRIVRHARVLLPRLRLEARDDAMQEVVANAAVAYARLAELGKEDVAYPTPLAAFAVRQYRDGRRVGSRLNVRDVSSPYAQKAKGFTLQRLDRFDAEEQCWHEILVEDRTVGPADLAASRMDFAAWLRTLPRRNRKLAMTLAQGESTGRAARLFGVSSGRVSQLRDHLRRSWLSFVGEDRENRKRA